jgi:hypothetical protein
LRPPLEPTSLSTYGHDNFHYFTPSFFSATIERSNARIHNMKVLKAFLALVSLAALLFTNSAQAETASGSVNVNEGWEDTHFDVTAGELLTITASGKVVHNPEPDPETDPEDRVNADGIGTFHKNGSLFVLNGTRTGASLGGGFLVDSAIVLSFVGRIGTTLVSEGVADKGAGFIGSSYRQIALNTGRLYLALNDENTPETFADNSGSFSVTATTSNSPPDVVPAAIVPLLLL